MAIQTTKGLRGAVVLVLYRERNGSTIYVKNFPTVLFLVKEIAKLERERFVFWPRLFREGGGHSDDQAVVLVAVLVLCVVLYRERNGSTIYVKNFPTVLFLVKEIAKLERERFVFWPRLFREGGGHSDDQRPSRGCCPCFI